MFALCKHDTATGVNGAGSPPASRYIIPNKFFNTLRNANGRKLSLADFCYLCCVCIFRSLSFGRHFGGFLLIFFLSVITQMFQSLSSIASKQKYLREPIKCVRCPHNVAAVFVQAQQQGPKRIDFPLRKMCASCRMDTINEVHRCRCIWLMDSLHYLCAFVLAAELLHTFAIALTMPSRSHSWRFRFRCL